MGFFADLKIIYDILRSPKKEESKEEELNHWFDKAKQEQAKNWVNKHWEDPWRRCECCRNNCGYTMSPFVYSLKERHDRGFIKDMEMPFIVFVCNKCGSSKLFNVMKMGLK